MLLNKIYCVDNRQSKIIKHYNKYIAKRLLKYNTNLGNNSVGNEVLYNNLKTAILNELKWLNNK